MRAEPASPRRSLKAATFRTRTVRVLKVTAFNERRGDAASARVLYEELSERRGEAE